VKATRLTAQEQPTIVERLFDAVVEGDPEKVLALLHSKVEWTPTAWSGEAMYRGHEGIHLWLSQFGESLQHLDVRVQKTATGDGCGAVLGIVFDTRGEQKFAVKVAWSYEMEDGLLRRGRAHNTWEEALEAVGLSDGSSPASPSEPALKAGRRALGHVRQVLRGDHCPVRRRLARRRRGRSAERPHR
jgi:ketosteroid isomerase-like protein